MPRTRSLPPNRKTKLFSHNRNQAWKLMSPKNNKHENNENVISQMYCKYSARHKSKMSKPHECKIKTRTLRFSVKSTFVRNRKLAAYYWGLTWFSWMSHQADHLSMEETAWLWLSLQSPRGAGIQPKKGSIAVPLQRGPIAKAMYLVCVFINICKYGPIDHTT